MKNTIICILDITADTFLLSLAQAAVEFEQIVFFSVAKWSIFVEKKYANPVQNQVIVV